MCVEYHGGMLLAASVDVCREGCTIFAVSLVIVVTMLPLTTRVANPPDPPLVS